MTPDAPTLPLGSTKCPCCNGTGRLSLDVLCVRCDSPLGWHTAHGLHCAAMKRGDLTKIDGTFAAGVPSKEPDHG